MNGAFQAIKVTDDVYWVGAIDWSVRDFHGYFTGRGTTYNAYLVLGEKTALIDTVKDGFAEEMYARIASVVDPRRIDVIVSNHSEPDHTGELAATISAVHPEAVYASKNGQKALQAHFGIGEQVRPVEDGSRIDLGGLSLVLAETRMCHWPDSMVSYLPERKLLFSQDAFGMHLASYERFDDEIDDGIVGYEAEKYYANILLPLSNFVSKALEKVQSAGWEIETICPDHGPIWRENPGRIVQRYADWAQQPRTRGAVVLYDTMWKSTEKMARSVAEGIGAAGGHPTLMSTATVHRSDVATRLQRAGGLIVGSPTLNNEIFPRIADTLTYIKGLRPKGLVGAAFGSYGWSGESIKKLNEFLQDMDVEILHEPVKSRYVPTDEVYQHCHELGQTLGRSLVERYG